MTHCTVPRTSTSTFPACGLQSKWSATSAIMRVVESYLRLAEDRRLHARTVCVAVISIVVPDFLRFVGHFLRFMCTLYFNILMHAFRLSLTLLGPSPSGSLRTRGVSSRRAETRVFADCASGHHGVMEHPKQLGAESWGWCGESTLTWLLLGAWMRN